MLLSAGCAEPSMRGPCTRCCSGKRVAAACHLHYSRQRLIWSSCCANGAAVASVSRSLQRQACCIPRLQRQACRETPSFKLLNINPSLGPWVATIKFNTSYVIVALNYQALANAGSDNFLDFFSRSCRSIFLQCRVA
jgi:hypothetical protein